MDEATFIHEIFEQGGAFLPGLRPAEADVAANLNRSVLVDNLSRSEAQLILSTLPREASGFYMRPLDKGLSGAAVFAGRYKLSNGTRSKIFVMKIGDRSKIEREADAILRHVAPVIQGISTPVTRYADGVGLLAQDFAGLGQGAQVRSLREAVRDSDESGAFIDRILRHRLSPWYSRPTAVSEIELGEVFRWYLTKGPTSSHDLCPPGWEAFPTWSAQRRVASTAPELFEMQKELRAQTITTPVGTAHGDLHAQNVLVEDHNNECWPIDFAWTSDQVSLVVDLVMLECSLKFLTIPMRSELGTLEQVELKLQTDPLAVPSVPSMPYSVEIGRVMQAVNAVRLFAVNDLNISVYDYQRALFMLTFALSAHVGLNRPYVLISLRTLGEHLG